MRPDRHTHTQPCSKVVAIANTYCELHTQKPEQANAHTQARTHIHSLALAQRQKEEGGRVDNLIRTLHKLTHTLTKSADEEETAAASDRKSPCLNITPLLKPHQIRTLTATLFESNKPQMQKCGLVHVGRSTAD